MPNFYLIGKLADHPRGKRLQKSVAAVASGELPESAGLCIGIGQDYQTRTPVEQRKWLSWAARPGFALLLVPPFQTSIPHEPNGWEMMSLDKTPILDHNSHPVLRLTQAELSVCVARGLSQTMNPMLEGSTAPQLSGLYRKHPDSGIFAVTCVPVWSLALADSTAFLTEWLSALMSLAGRPIDADHPTSCVSFEPKQSHYSAMLYLAFGQFSNRKAALQALEWNDTFDLSGEDVPSLLDELEVAGLISGGTLSEKGRCILLESPYRPFAEVYLNRSSSL